MTNTDINPDKPLRGRRLTWAEFERLTGKTRPEPANDNESVTRRAQLPGALVLVL